MAQVASLPSPGRHQRRMKNYLLDRHFQLKYSSYLVGITLVLSACLGFLLWRTSESVISQSQEVVRHGREVVEESRKVSAVVQMNIVKDPVYSDNPALLEAFKSDATRQDELLRQQQKTLENQAVSLARQQSVMLYSLCGALLLLVVLIGVAGIVVTHRVAGPIYKMKLNLKAVADGRLNVPTPLRKGDELVDFFEAYRAMVIALRTRQESEIEKLDGAIQALEPKAEPGELEPLHALKREMKSALET